MGPACSFPASMERNLMPDPFSSSDLPANSVRVPPHSVESEQTILGGLMLNTQAFDQISDIITAEDFYRADHRVIFDAIAALHLRGEPADVITVYNELERSGRADPRAAAVPQRADKQFAWRREHPHVRGNRPRLLDAAAARVRRGYDRRVRSRS